MTIQNLGAWARFAIYRHGWVAVLGVVLIAAALGMEFIGIEQARTRLAELRSEALAQRQRQVQQPRTDETASKRLAVFYDSLPAPEGMHEAVDTIHRAAKASGVKLATGEYRLVREGSAGLLRYQISLPARASYPKLRTWLAVVMNALPAAALNDISFKREDIASESVEANVRLTLFLRAP